MFKKFLLGTAGVLVAATMAATAANAGLVIDDFTDLLENSTTGDGDGIVFDSTANSISVFDRSVQILGTILGGDRELILNKVSGGGLVNAFVDAGTFNHSNPTNGLGSSLLRWDGSGSGDTADREYGLGGIDLLTSGNYFHVSLLSAGTNSAATVDTFITIGLYTSADVFSEYKVVLPTFGPLEFYKPLAEIVALGLAGSGGAVDLTNVNAIEMFVEGAEGYTASMDIVDLVPEPASLTLLGAGIMGLGAVKRRRKA